MPKTSSKTIKMETCYCYFNDFVEDVAPRMLYVYTRSVSYISKVAGMKANVGNHKRCLLKWKKT